MATVKKTVTILVAVAPIILLIAIVIPHSGKALSTSAQFSSSTPYPPPGPMDQSQSGGDLSSAPYPAPFEQPASVTQEPTPTVDPTIAQGNISLLMDAKMYSSAMGVDMNEAIRRLKLQDDIGELNRELSVQEEDTFAGLWIQHQPDFRVVAMFTKGGEYRIKPYIKNGPLANLVDVKIASATLKELESARLLATQTIKNLNIQFSSAINIPKNRAELYVLDPTQLNAGLQNAKALLPDSVDVVKFAELHQPVEDIFGGKAITTCTTGFSVANAYGIKGVTTAGHCQNTQYYNGVLLPFMGGTTGGVYDIQWHRADQAFTVRNLIWDGTYNRYIFGVKFRASQTVGEWVCKYGKSTHYDCGTIATTSQDGVNVRVDNVVVDSGDSGGPWFWNNTAYGTTIAYCQLTDGTPCSIYGPVDHIYNILGLKILPYKEYLPLVLVR